MNEASNNILKQRPNNLISRSCFDINKDKFAYLYIEAMLLTFKGAYRAQLWHEGVAVQHMWLYMAGNRILYEIRQEIKPDSMREATMRFNFIMKF